MRRRLLAVFLKEFRQIRRDPLSLGMLVLVPVALLILYGYALSFDVRHIPVAVLDEDATPASRALQDSLFQNEYFRRRLVLRSAREADGELVRGTVKVVLRIPRGFARGVARGERTAVQVLVDGADATTAAVAVGYLDAMADRATLALRQAVLARGGPAVGAAAAIPSVITQPRIWFNPDLESSHFLIPGLIAMLLMLAAVIATSLSIVREKERRTIDQIMVSPLRPAELILGKILPYVVICLVTLALVLALGRVLFGVRIQGSHALLALTTLLFLFAALGLGLLISAMTRSQQVAFQMAILTSLLPSLILSGLIFPIRNMPLPIQGVSLLVIPRYFVAALRGVILKGATLADLWPDLGALLLFGLVFNGLAGRRIRKAV